MVLREKLLFRIRRKGIGMRTIRRKADEVNVIALVKRTPGERYVFMYDDRNRHEMLRQFGRLAANRDLSFTWHDAAILSQKVRLLKEQNDA